MENHTEQNNQPKGELSFTYCANCGTMLSSEQDACPNCGTVPTSGQTHGAPTSAETNAPPTYTYTPPAEQNSKKILVRAAVCGIALFAITIVIGVANFGGTKVDEIVLAEEFIELAVDESKTVAYAINPKKTDNINVTWESSDSKVAVVYDGEITATGEGSCTITATAKGKSDSVTVTVTKKIDFKEIYNKLSKPSYCKLGKDNSYLSIDTNQYDRDDYFDLLAYGDLEEIIEMLELPESLLEEMGRTRALDGRVTRTIGKLEVSWSYHPDKGLAVTFKKI